MKDQIDKLMQRSQNALSEAQFLLSELSSFDTCVSRSYYACFYSAQACLISQKLTIKSHRGLITMFGKHLVLSGLIEKEYGRNLQLLFEKRQNSDYLIMQDTDQQEAEAALQTAQKFVERMRIFLDENEGQYD